MNSLPIRGYGCVTDIGRTRPKNEDQTSILEDAHTSRACSYFGVYDGHGGPATSLHLKRFLHSNIISHPSFAKGNMKEAFVEGYQKTDREILGIANAEGLMRSCGSTATSVLVTADKLHIAHVGDSRAILCRKGKAKELTKDHRANSYYTERKRVEAAGGWIDKAGYVNNGLAVTRAFGDIEFKSNKSKVFRGKTFTADLVIPTPDYSEVELTVDDSFMVLASDGVWDDMSNEEVISECETLLRRHRDPQAVCQKVVDHVVKHGKAEDNVTMILVWFDHESR